MKTLFPILLFILICHVLPGSHNYNLKFNGGAKIENRENSGVEARETGLLDIYGCFSPMNSHQGSFFRLRAARLLKAGLLQEAGIKTGIKNIVRVGYLQQRLGLIKWYRYNSVYSPYFDRYFLWDFWGSGVDWQGKKVFLNVDVDLSILINSRNSGGTYMSFSRPFSKGNIKILTGYQHYSPENQDGSWISGGNFFYESAFFNGNVMTRYTKYFGSDAARNPTMKPGWELNNTGEFRFQVGKAGLNLLADNKYYKKRFIHKEYRLGAEFGYKIGFHKHGILYEWFSNDNTISQQVFLSWVFAFYEAWNVSCGVGTILSAGENNNFLRGETAWQF